MTDMKKVYDVLTIINLYIVSLTENDLIFKAILTLVLDFMYILKLLVERSSVLTRQLTIKTATKIWPLNEQPPNSV